jgi:uncharacterized repeat protein (TIGR01451 family)
MKRVHNFASIQSLLSSLPRSIFSSTEHSKASNPTSKRLSRFRALSVRIALSMLLAAMLLSPSAARMFRGSGSVTAFDESITTYAANCEDPQPGNSWNLGGTACAKVSGAPEDRRIAWVAPDGSVAQVTGFFSGTASDTYTIQTGTNPLAQPGTWTVQTIDPSGTTFATAQFIVRDPANASADLSVADFGPFQTSAGNSVSYRVELTNRGPDPAQTVVLTTSVPGNTTFVSETPDSGFSCTTLDVGSSTGTIDCTIATLPANSTAIFTFVFNVDSGTANGTVITDAASVSSTTNDPHLGDNSASTSTTVVSATSGCTVTCPSPPSVSTAQCNAVVTYGTPTLSGDCGGSVVCSPPSGSVFPIGNTTVTCTTQSGDSCTFAATVNYTGTSSTPTITCPSNITMGGVSGGTTVVFYPAPTTTGNCVTVVCNPPSGSVFSTGTTTVNCTATNPANNTATCSFTVTVSSNSCALDCPDDKTVNESAPGSGSATVTYSNAAAVGPCPSLTISCSPPSGSIFPVGLNTVNCSGSDGTNVVAACSFSITVNSLPTCAITCPANITQAANATCSGSPCATVNYATPTKSGNCSADPVVCNPPSGSSFGIGTTTVNCFATDPAGNPSACSFTVTITGGGTQCTITCPANISQSSGGCGNVVTYPNPTTTGNCGDDVPPWSCNPPSGSFFPVGATTVVCSTDVGNQCSFTVTITGNDAIAPTINSCASPTIALADSTCQGPVPNVTSDVDASDNCTPTNLLLITQSPAAGTLVGTGTTTITVTVRDANNNSSTCTTFFTLFEPTPPTALCKNTTVFLNATGNASITAADVDNGSTDNCAIATRTVTPSTFTCANKGANTVTLTVTDPSGNSSQCTATVTVIDNTPPAISCPANITLEPTCPAGAIATYTAPVGTDNCPGATTARTAGPASGSVFPIGTTTVTYTVTDGAGLTASCSFTVTVKTAAAVVQNLIARVQALQPPLTGQQSQGLVSKLQAALDAINNGQTNVACNKLNDFISQVQAYINGGTLTSAQGQPLINSAAKVRNTLGCTSLPCS